MPEQGRTRGRPSDTATDRGRSQECGPSHAARNACRRLERLIDAPAEGASAVRRTDDGWLVVVDVLEVERIPDTTSLLAAYEVRLGQDGELLEYRRVRRYRRGSVDE